MKRAGCSTRRFDCCESIERSRRAWPNWKASSKQKTPTIRACAWSTPIWPTRTLGSSKSWKSTESYSTRADGPCSSYSGGWIRRRAKASRRPSHLHPMLQTRRGAGRNNPRRGPEERTGNGYQNALARGAVSHRFLRHRHGRALPAAIRKLPGRNVSGEVLRERERISLASGGQECPAATGLSSSRDGLCRRVQQDRGPRRASAPY